MSAKIHRHPRFQRQCPSVYSYRAELLYGRRFNQRIRTSGMTVTELRIKKAGVIIGQGGYNA